MTQDEYMFLISIRSILLMAVDKIDRRCGLGKYKPSRPVTLQPTDSIASAAVVTETTETNVGTP